MENFIYTGEGDPEIKIGGQVQNFALEGSENRQFSFTVTNAAEAVLTAQLFAGFNTGNATVRPGQITDGAFNDVSGTIGLSASSGDTRVKIAEIQRYLQQNPTRVVRMRIQSDKDAQITQALFLGKLDIFNAEASETIRPRQSSDAFQSGIIEFDTDFQIDDLADVRYNFVGASETTITFFCGASLEKATALRRKAAIARAHVNRVGHQAIIAESIGKPKMIK